MRARRVSASSAPRHGHDAVTRTAVPCTRTLPVGSPSSYRPDRRLRSQARSGAIPGRASRASSSHLRLLYFNRGSSRPGGPYRPGRYARGELRVRCALKNVAQLSLQAPACHKKSCPAGRRLWVLALPLSPCVHCTFPGACTVAWSFGLTPLVTLTWRRDSPNSRTSGVPGTLFRTLSPSAPDKSYVGSPLQTRRRNAPAHAMSP